jgi:MSHA biogenesis protein MshJ
MSDSLAVSWKKSEVWFAVRPKREKLILSVASLAVVFALVDALWLTPVGRQLSQQTTAIQKKEKELAQLDEQRAALQQAITARLAEHRREFELAQGQLTEVVGQLAEFEKSLVPAKQMPDFLQGLLPGAGVEIVGLRTLEPTPLIVRSAAKDTAKEGADPKGEKKTPGPAAVSGVSGGATNVGGANIYRHGIEITLAGNYDGLLAYLVRLEASPRKVMWGRLELNTVKYPRNEMTLVLYTLSLDPSWLMV